MTRSTVIAVFFAAAGVLAAGQAFAQEAASGPGVVELTIIPGGGTFFTEDSDGIGPDAAPAFGNYQLGGAVGVNFSRYVGVEGELSGALGLSQDLRFGGLTANRKSPNLLNYSGNVVVSAANHTSVVPYVTAGVGGLSLLENAGLGIDRSETFLTGNVGGGLKWYSGRWGLRADYRFVGVRARDDAPGFFGRQTRYGHRVYGGVILNVAN